MAMSSLQELYKERITELLIIEDIFDMRDISDEEFARWNRYEKWFGSLDEDVHSKIRILLLSEIVFLNEFQLGITPLAIVNDVFVWGSADAEPIMTPKQLEDLYGYFLWDRYAGPVIWACIQRNEKPQWPVEKRLRERGLWDFKLVQGLKDNYYDNAIGRWKEPGSYKRAIKEIGNV